MVKSVLFSFLVAVSVSVYFSLEDAATSLGFFDDTFFLFGFFLADWS